MVKLLAELHGGSVSVESEVGKGSRFTVWIPLRSANREIIGALPVFPSAPLEPLAGVRTALVVEDDYKSAELIRVQLEAEGFIVLHAPTAEAALELAGQQPLSLITLDIMLPNMDGWEFLGRIKKIPALSHIPVVIVSIVAEATKGFALGAASVMEKPISRQELSDALVALGLFPVTHGKSLKVLVVDDDPEAVELMAVRMRGLADPLLRAFGGREAVEIARAQLPDLIVLDLMMPEMSGFEVVTALQETPATARIPVVVVTAKQVTAQDRARLNGYVKTIVEKGGVERDEFLGEVRRAMSGRSAPV